MSETASLERRVSGLERNYEQRQEGCDRNFRDINDRLTRGSKTMAEHEVRLENLMQWKIAQNGVLSEIKDELKAQRQEGQKAKNIMIGILTSLVVSAILLAINIAIGV